MLVDVNKVELVFSIQEFIKLVPGLILFPFSLYLSAKKIGEKVAVTYSISSSRICATQLSSIALTNLKDKPIAVFSIYCVIGKDVMFEVDKFSPPLILKSLETIGVKPAQFSYLDIGGDAIDVADYTFEKMQIFLETDRGIVKCVHLKNASMYGRQLAGGYRIASKITKNINGVVYNDFAAYVIVYEKGGGNQTAIVDGAGLVHGQWDFGYNFFPPEALESAEMLRKTLEDAGFDKVTKGFSVQDLNKFGL